MTTDSPSLIVHQHLVDDHPDIFTEPQDDLEWSLFIAFLPDVDIPESNTAAIFDTVGIKDGRFMSGDSVFHHGLQIMMRSATHIEGWEKAEALSVALDAIKQTVVIMGPKTYTIAAATQSAPPLFVGLEEGSKRRFLFSVNFTVSIAQTVT